jgi:hypothetical protein
MVNGKLEATFTQLFEAGCIQTGSDYCDTVDEAEKRHARMFAAIFNATDYNPCDGCPINYKECEAFHKYHTFAKHQVTTREERIRKATTPPSGESVAQMAQRLGISKNEVRRRKHKGEI